MEQKHGHNANDGQLAETVHCVAAQVEHAQDNEQIDENNAEAADEAERLADGSEDKVRPVFGHIVQLAECALHECAAPRQTAGSDGNFGVGLLVGCGCIRQRRINEAEDTLQSVAVRAACHHVAVQNGNGNGAHGHNGNQHADTRAAKVHHDTKDKYHYKHGSHFALCKRQSARNTQQRTKADPALQRGKRLCIGFQ